MFAESEGRRRAGPAAAAVVAVGVMLAGCAAAAAGAVGAAAAPHLVGCNESSSVRPDHYNPICNDGAWTVVHLRWSRWSGTARGTGKFYTHNCVPDCAHGKVRLYDVDVIAWRVRVGDYTRFRYDFTRSVPRTFPHSWTIRYYGGHWHGRVV